MRVTAKADYAVRAMVELAAAPTALHTAEAVAERQGIPLRFLLNILNELRVARLVQSRRGREGGYRLARAAAEISVADVIRAVEGPLADVHGTSPEDLDYPGPTAALREVWIATRRAVRGVLETVSLAEIASGEPPVSITHELAQPDALRRR
ncbi:MAG: Rrf2 family transcriptional regulator [Pseudonocardiaceae bacterium]|nr:Rrf2 family transcriptional regulator [Pseudonocardiaceae bacterium]